MTEKFDSDKAFGKVLVSSLEAELMPQSRQCPDSGTLSAYYEGTLTEAETSDCERHVSSCAPCQKQLAALAQLDPKESEAAPEPATGAGRWGWKWTASTALAATAVLAIFVTYRFRPVIEEASRRAVSPRVSLEKRGAPSASPLPSAEQLGAEAAKTDKPAELAQASPVATAPPMNDQDASARPAASSAPPEAQVAASAAKPAAPAAMLARAPTAAPAATEPSPAGAAEAMSGSLRQAAKREAPRGTAANSLLRDDKGRATEGSPVIVVARSNQNVLWRLDGSRIERSDDGGKSWQPQTTGTTTALTAGSAPSPEVAWVVGRHGAVLRTADGQRWERIASPTEEALVKVTAFGASEATVTSAGGRRFSTGDGGKTWSAR